MTEANNLLNFGHAYTKTDLSSIFDDPNIKSIREGIYSVKSYDSVFLFVDLIKAGKEERFHFNDYFDGDIFHWDSQTTQNINSPRIQSIAKKKVEVNLFCRMYKKVKGVTQPFYYCGRLEYIEHDPTTSNPVHIVFLSMDFDETTSNPNLIELYNWKPHFIGKSTSNNDYSEISRPKKTTSVQKKPNYTERRGLVTSRVGQGYYRQHILHKWQYQCAITGCNVQSILISSHIKRWSESNDEERLDPNNGILLSPNADALFDKHLISFTNEGEILISNKIDETQLLRLGLTKTSKLSLNNEMIPYLEHHRNRFLELERKENSIRRRDL